MNANLNIIYGRYTRKSSESEDRQALSIESQNDELIRLERNKGIVVSETNMFSEAKSAKTAYKRTEFEVLINRIENGSIQGIVVWHPNRLSRNAIDAARLVDLMDKGRLVEIVTPGQAFRNTPNDKFMFGLMCLQAKMENDSKSIDIKRGLRKKNEIGFPAGVCKPGYENDRGLRGFRKIIIDSERFHLVKQLLEMFVSGNYSTRELLRYSDSVLGLKTIQRKKEGGKPLKLSRFYEMLKDPFYAGFFYRMDENGQRAKYEVHESVPRMISEEQYWKIQSILGRRGVPRPSTSHHTFAYLGRTKCGSCGGSVTAEQKFQVRCSACKKKFSCRHNMACPGCQTKIAKMETPRYLHYIYYHCTGNRDPKCPGGSVQEKGIDSSVAAYIEDNIEISKELGEWCIKHLGELSKKDKQNDYERKASWEKQKSEKQAEYDELLRMKMKFLVDDLEFLKLKEGLKFDMQRIDRALSDLDGANTSSLEEAKGTFTLAIGLSESFKSGDFEAKQTALTFLGSNLTIKDKKLSISNKKVFSIIAEGFLEARAINGSFEPKKCEADKDKSGTFAAVCPTLLRMLNDVRTSIMDELYLPRQGDKEARRRIYLKIARLKKRTNN